MKSALKKQISSIVKKTNSPTTPRRKSVSVVDESLLDQLETADRIIARNGNRLYLPESYSSSLPDSLSRPRVGSMPHKLEPRVLKSHDFEYSDNDSANNSLVSSTTSLPDIQLSENAMLDDIIHLQDRLLQALSTIKQLKKERNEFGKLVIDKLERTQQKDKQLRENVERACREDTDDLLSIIHKAKKMCQSDFTIDRRAMDQIFVSLQSRVLHFQQYISDQLGNPLLTPEFSNSPSSPSFSRPHKALEREKLKLEENILDLEEELEVAKFTNTLFVQSQGRFEEEVRSLQSTVLSLKQSKSSLEQEVMELKEKLEEVTKKAQVQAKPKPSSVLEKMMEELRENVSHETKERERWRRYYIEAVEESEELKDEIEKQQKSNDILRKENQLLEKELEEQAAIYQKCRDLDGLVRKKLESQLADFENELVNLKDRKGDESSFVLDGKMREKTYSEMLLKQQEQYQKEHEERAKRREELIKKEEEEIQAKRLEFKRRAVYDTVQQKVMLNKQ